MVVLIPVKNCNVIVFTFIHNYDIIYLCMTATLWCSGVIFIIFSLDDSFVLYHIKVIKESIHQTTEAKRSDDPDVKSWILQYAEQSSDTEHVTDDDESDPVGLFTNYI